MQLLKIIKSRKPLYVTGAVSAVVFATVVRTQCAELPHWAEWNVTARDGVSTTREYLEVQRDETTGMTTTREHRLVEIAGGLNYWDNGWKPSQDLIELTETGAAATKGPHRVDFASNFSSPGLITITTPRGIMQTHVIGIYYFDASSGETAQLAIPKEAVGELHPPNSVATGVHSKG